MAAGDLTLDQETIADASRLIQMALTEDLGSDQLAQARDCTTLALAEPGLKSTAKFVARGDGIVCGLPICQMTIDRFAPDVELSPYVSDADAVQLGQAIAGITGDARQILMLERTCLNFLCRLSGISTLTEQFVRRVQETNARVLDTRKTTPGWRRLEKYAVRCGGGDNHRMGLFDAIMIKDNHLAMNSRILGDQEMSIPDAIARSRVWIEANSGALPNGQQTVVQVEVDTLSQLKIALQAAPDIVLLDNMTTEQLTEAVQIRNQLAVQVQLEASGGVNLETVKSIARSGVERISIGALTHSAVNFDIGLDWIPGDSK